MQETVREQRTEIVVRQAPAPEAAPQPSEKPLVAAVREWPQTVEQVARQRTITQGQPYHREILELYRLAAQSVHRLQDLIRPIDDHIRANAGERDAEDKVERFVLENGDRLGGLRGSTKMFDFAGREERREALRALEEVAFYARVAARTYADQLQNNREDEESRRRHMSVEIPALSQHAQSMLTTMEQSRPDMEQSAKLMNQLDENPALKGELEAHSRAMAKRFGAHYATQGVAAIEARLPPEDRARAEEIFRPTRILEAAKLDDVLQRQRERAQQQGITRSR